MGHGPFLWGLRGWFLQCDSPPPTSIYGGRRSLKGFWGLVGFLLLSLLHSLPLLSPQFSFWEWEGSGDFSGCFRENFSTLFSTLLSILFHFVLWLVFWLFQPLLFFPIIAGQTLARWPCCLHNQQWGCWPSTTTINRWLQNYIVAIIAWTPSLFRHSKNEQSLIGVGSFT